MGTFTNGACTPYEIYSLPTEVISRPQKVKWGKDNWRCVCFKACGALLGFLTVEGSLYLCGEGAECYTGSVSNTPQLVDANLVDFSILDFSIAPNLIAFVTSQDKSSVLSVHASRLRTMKESMLRRKL